MMYRFILGVLFCVVGWVDAQSAVPKYEACSRMAFQLLDQAWVVTHRVKTVLQVHATLRHQSIAQAKSHILKRLASLDPQALWYVVNFDQGQDPSGLERIDIKVQARIPQFVANVLMERLKAMSQNGEKYQIAHLSYQPSILETEQAYAQLRGKIYHQIRAEITRIKQIFHQRYQIQSLTFHRQGPKGSTSMGLMNATSMNKADHHFSAIPTGNQITLEADVELCSLMREKDESLNV